MEQMNNLKETLSTNLKYYLNINNKTQSEVCEDLSFTTSTVSDWINAKKYPRMDKIQMLADYFGILKSDLTEVKGGASSYLNSNIDETSDEILVINRAAKNMNAEEKKKMLDLLKVAFSDKFDK